MRRALVVIHRWLGLFTAVFLIVAGASGTLIAWDHELDEWLNPELFELPPEDAEPSAPLLSGLDLARGVEARDPTLRVRATDLTPEPGHALLMFVEPRVDPRSGRPYELTFNQIAVNPRTGAVQGRRHWGSAELTRQNFMPFMLRLHYSLHLPEVRGVETGFLLMGLVGIVWALDALIALWLAFPSGHSFRKSFRYRLRQGGAKLTFDLHRSTGVWVWGLLLMLAVTGVAMNLRSELMRPLVSLFSPLTPSPFDTPAPTDGARPEPMLSREQAVTAAEREAARRGIAAPPNALYFEPDYGLYGVGFFAADDAHGDGGLGNPWLYVDGRTGEVVGAEIPGTGSAGDIFMQAQFPLHSGRLFGLAGRVAVSLLGVVVVMLSITGLLIWARKRRARAHSAARVRAARGPSSTRTLAADQLSRRH